MIHLIFSFDTEDYETPGSDDAAKIWADLLDRHGFTGCFCVVGEKARALRDRGRRDVIEALARHEISTHSNWHSRHPTHVEYLDGLGWEDGVSRVIAEEIAGLSDVRDIFGQQPISFCKPGSSWGPQGAYAMFLMDVPIFCDAPFEWTAGQPMWYTNQLFLKYHIAFDSYFGAENEAGRLERMKADFRKICERNEGGYVVMFSHPCRLVTTQFPDHFRAGKNPPRSEWEPAPLCPQEEIDVQIRDIDAFLEWAAGEPDLEPTVYREVWDAYKPRGTVWLSRRELTRLAQNVCERPDWMDTSAGPISPAEGFAALAFALHGFHQSKTLPKEVPVAPPVGPGFFLASSAGDSSGQDVVAAASWAYREVVEGRQVPPSIPLGPNTVGPASLLGAMATCYETLASKGKEPEQVSLMAEALPVLAEREDIARYGFKGWTILPPEFEGRHVLEMIRLQTWTAKPARNIQ